MKPLYVAIDSDVLINFAKIYYGKERGVSLTQNTKDRIIEFLNDVKSNKYAVRFIVPSVVFNEVHNPQVNSEIVDDFIKELCYIPLISPNELNYAKKAEKLAYSYCEINDDGGLSPMKIEYSAATGKYVPSNDAYIMGEATTLGINLITFNEKDYVSASKTRYDKSRAHKILEINKNHRCFFDDYCNVSKIVSPRPYHVMEFINLLYSDKFLHFPAPRVEYSPRIGKNQIKFNDSFLIR